MALEVSGAQRVNPTRIVLAIVNANLNNAKPRIVHVLLMHRNPTYPDVVLNFLSQERTPLVIIVGYQDILHVIVVSIIAVITLTLISDTSIPVIIPIVAQAARNPILVLSLIMLRINIVLVVMSTTVAIIHEHIHRLGKMKDSTWMTT